MKISSSGKISLTRFRRGKFGPSGSPSFQPERCNIPKPLLEGPISSQTGGVNFPSEGGGSRARISARVGAGIDTDEEGGSD